MLVCTTIVETGLDISNANTLIVERADVIGLSQLHQLRGRVGRGRERGLRLLPVPAGEAADRDGARPAGHHRRSTPTSAPACTIAMKDLEIRGAGNLLGGEQSGHIAGVGFDLYVRLVGEAVADFKGEGSRGAAARSRSSCPVDAHLPHDYIPGERLRLEAYRKLAAVGSEEDLEAVRAELRRPLRRAADPGDQPASRSPASGCWPAAPG